MQTPINNSSVYRGWILAFLWVYQVLIEIIITGVFAVAITNLNWLLAHPYEDYSDNWPGSFVNSRLAQDAVNQAIIFSACATGVAVLFLLTHIAQITLYTRSKLTPVRNFCFELPRFLLWTVVFALVLAGVRSRTSSTVSIVFVVLIWVLYLLSMVYASVVLHRYRRGDFKGAEVMHPSRVHYQYHNQYRTAPVAEMA